MPSKIRDKHTEYALARWADRRNIEQEMSEYWGRIGDHAVIKNAIITRYGQWIREDKLGDPDDPENTSTVQTYVRGKFEKLVDAGAIEAIGSGWGHRVVSARSNLFSEPGNKFELVHPTIEDTVELEEYINEQRKDAGFMSKIQKLDRYSNSYGSSAMLIQGSSGKLSYQVFTPQRVIPFFGDTVIENDVPRFADKSNLEDAYCVVVMLSQEDYDQYNWLAIFARSEDWPDGRYVTFQSDNPENIPGVDDPGGHDYTEMTGGPCNPMSVYANQNPELQVPEYPIVVFDGGLADSDECLPLSSSLYRDALQIDVAASHTLSTSQEESRGVKAIERDERAKGYPLPLTLSGPVALYPGQSLNMVQGSGQVIVAAMDTLKQLQADLAAGYGVPDYMVIRDQSLTSPSGVSIALRTKPLTQVRENRIDENTSEVSKIFKIESIYATLFDDSAPAQLEECEMIWTPGRMVLPKDRSVESTRIRDEIADGLIDVIEGLRQQYDLPSDDEAIELYDKMAVRREQYPALNAADKEEDDYNRAIPPDTK